MISSNFLNELTIFVDSKVNKVVLNENYEITNFTLKEIKDNVLSLQYIVPFGSVDHIEKVELKDPLDNVITSNNVFVPVVAESIISQEIIVKEANG